MGFEIKFYKTADGKCPVEIFLDKIPTKASAKIAWTLELFEELDFISTQYFKKLKNSDDIWEIRIKLGSNIYRIFCFFIKGKIIVLTHGLVKKTQKTPKKEIEKAENYKRDYIERYKNE